ncbi:Transcriptional regulator, AbiEi antitoxin, Type IV TA system [Klenkia soli]|uniref:Transcriptional regulator, AbiEi antitoxin, Type IV TA system n=1 Tax=Klenkia soli TaxID=1052260 RepID=A0A1H0NZE1_9ACTN|nr:hypothetical protein [Klenkia soli]SDO98074.1 Transcriptional regulator, AbiEi antitoxin, Type IV TA system [Klenkia soli]
MLTAQLGLHPFRGSTAVQEGLLTRGVLRSRRFKRLYPDVYVAAGVQVTHAVLAAAATVLLPGAVVSGVSALEVAGVPCALPGDRVEVTVPPGHRGVAVPGLRVRRRALPDGQVFADLRGFLRLHPAAAAVEVAAERRPHMEAVVVLDQVAHHRVAGPAALELFAGAFRGRGRQQLLAALADADFLAESPQETRLRLPLHASELPKPEAQHRIRTRGGRKRRLDFAWPDIRFAVEYDGEHHATRLPEDRARLNELQELGWRVFYVTRADMRDIPALVAAITRAYEACLAHRLASQG